MRSVHQSIVAISGTMLSHYSCSQSLRHCLLLAMIVICYGRNFEKCKLARKLSSSGFRNSEIRSTLCYGSLSDYNNQFLVIMNNETFYGLLAIHEPWCAPSSHESPVSTCNVYCKYMLDDNLRNDINCLRKIVHGNGRWSTEFKQFYDTNSLINMSECEKTVLDDCGLSNDTDRNRILPPAVPPGLPKEC